MCSDRSDQFELAGFPHSEISGSRVVCTSPELIAAYHVLHRLHAPRHPPCALSSLTIKFAHRKLGSAHRFSLRLVLLEIRRFQKNLNFGNFAYSIIKERYDDLCRPLQQTRCRASTIHVRDRRQFLVEVRGFEPLTPWLQTMCSAN